MKRRYWPFVFHKWLRPQFMGCDLYAEGIAVKDMPWEVAYESCSDDMIFIDKHAENFDNRWRSGLLRFILVAILSVFLVSIVVLICWRTEMEKALPIIVCVSLTVVLVELLIRVLYYRGIEFDLIHADNRISALQGIWPEIVEIVSYDLRNGTFTPNPPSPEYRHPSAEDVFYFEDDPNLIVEDIEEQLEADDDVVVVPEPPKQESYINTLGELKAQIDALNKHLQEGS